MTRKLRRLISLFLCATTVLGVVLPQTQALAAADSMAMMADHDAASPCGGCDEDTTSLCSEHCAALSAGIFLPAAPDMPAVVAAAQQVVGFAPAGFESHAGRPGLQPPR